MKIFNRHIHSAKYIKHCLLSPHPTATKEDKIQLLQIYECRILGVCIYRTVGSYINLKREIDKYENR